MAALATGVQYGLSSRSSDSKFTLFFVKLTDSSYRAIEEFTKNADRTSQAPTIQFLSNNKGHLSIPVSSSRPEIFSFNISRNSEGGNIVECLQSTGSRALESLGPLSQTINIQAKEDSYETTKHKMAAVEEQQKKNRTKVIKPTVNEIGRTVKLIPGSTTSATSHISNSLSSKNAFNSSSRSLMHNPSSQQHSRVVSNNHAQKPANPEIMRRPLRERLIHTLALRPFKKPELMDRIFREGCYEKDRKQFHKVLQEVSNYKGNTFELIRGLWNDVQEDWPFYSEQERQTLKRRKPQNLTPPGSSDTGSTGSGQSPTSTHPGSPPSVIQSSLKRTFESVDVVPTKKRISHFQRQPNDSSYRSVTDPFMAVLHPQDYDEEAQRFNNRIYGDTFSLDERQDKRIANSNHSKDRFKKENRTERTPMVNNKNVSDIMKKSSVTSDVSNKRPNSCLINNVTDSSDCKRFKNNSNTSEKIYERKLEETIKRSDSPATVTSSQPQSCPKYDVNYADTRPSYDDTDDKIQENTVSASSELPDYVTEYSSILNAEQRRKYKADFLKDYEEYKTLHSQLEAITAKFSDLEGAMQKARSPGEKEGVKDTIRRLSRKMQEDPKYHEIKKRFHYLHAKLKHIKDLVAEYDRTTDY